ncbi:MAG: DUF3566 domain-containing protein [Actinomycetia bacterium]|nr:DUF3566 domain-containing protein [Actinomycetes bacterium]
MSSSNEPGYPQAGKESGTTGGSTEDVADTAGSGTEGGALGNSVARGGPTPSASKPAHSAQTGDDVPPWQRGPASRAEARQRSAESAPQAGGPSKSGGGLDARLNRFIAGSPAAGSAAPAAGSAAGSTGSAGSAAPAAGSAGSAAGSTGSAAPATHGEPAQATRSDPSSAAYGSELPDLSEGNPRPQQQRKQADRPVAEPPAKLPAQATTSGRAVQLAAREYKGPVRASMQIRQVDPWSALKVSLVLSVAMFFVWMIAVAFLYLVLGGMGVWSKLNSNVGDLLTSASGSVSGELVSSGTIFGGAALIGLVNIVLMTAGATIGAFIYNLTTDLVGGVEVTLADRD